MSIEKETVGEASGYGDGKTEKVQRDDRCSEKRLFSRNHRRILTPTKIQRNTRRNSGQCWPDLCKNGVNFFKKRFIVQRNIPSDIPLAFSVRQNTQWNIPIGQPFKPPTPSSGFISHAERERERRWRKEREGEEAPWVVAVGLSPVVGFATVHCVTGHLNSTTNFLL